MSDIERLDIPESVSKELDNLHLIVRSENSSEAEKLWAQKLIQKIHDFYFNGAVFLNKNSGDTL